VLIGWTIIITTLFHDIIFAIKYNIKVPQVQVHTSPIDWDFGGPSIDPGVFDKLFPFCCLSHHEPTEWVSLWERLKFLTAVSIFWGFITLLWFLVKKGILSYYNDDDLFNI